MNMRIARTVARSASIVTLSVALTVSGQAQNPQAEPPDIPRGPAPIVDAIETKSEPEPSVFRASPDRAAPIPHHPPIDQIPPMPMATPEEDESRAASSGPGAGVLYSPWTRREYTWPATLPALTGRFARGGGYAGADGGGEKSWPAGMSSNMSLIATGTRRNHPWRMNVKLVMRFDNSYFVCSGTMRDAETVLTAGHCVYDHEYGFGWADEIWVYPGWDGNGSLTPNPPTIANPYGWARGTHFGSWTGWTRDANWNYDVGLVGVTRAVGMLTGWFGWSYGGSCNYWKSKTVFNASYPAEGCGQSGLHNGRGMYYWSGTFDSCPSFNRLQLETTGGCFNAVWGGMSGSGAYKIDNGNRYVHAITSTSNRFNIARYARQFESWVNWSNNVFIPAVRGSAFDLQALDVDIGTSTVTAGSRTTGLSHLATNPANGAANKTFKYRVYLSTNSNVSTADTLLSTQFYSRSFGAMRSARVNMAQVTIPANTPPGIYYLGVIYDSATDGRSGNNDSDAWDAVRIRVTSRE